MIQEMNMFRPYPLNDFQLEEWAMCLNKYIPDLSIEILRKVVENLLLGVTEYNHHNGIQNIFIGYRLLKRNTSTPDYESFRNG